MFVLGSFVSNCEKTPRKGWRLINGTALACKQTARQLESLAGSLRAPIIPGPVCTIALLHQIRADRSLVVAANRDEFYAREWTGPLILDQQGRIFGGRDIKGGSWMGVNKDGIFVGLTNQRSALAPPANVRSRGEIVLNALECTSLDAIEELVNALNPSEYPEFNLAIGDGERLFVVYARHNGLQIHWLKPGLHILTNDHLLSPKFPKAKVLAGKIEPFLAQPWVEFERTLQTALGTHERPPTHELLDDPHSPLPTELAHELQALCIHTPFYGTRSSTITALDDHRVTDYLFAPGSPCVTTFANHSDSLPV